MLFKDNKIRPQYMTLILQEFGIGMDEFVRYYNEMTRQMKNDSPSN